MPEPNHDRVTLVSVWPWAVVERLTAAVVYDLLADRLAAAIIPASDRAGEAPVRDLLHDTAAVRGATPLPVPGRGLRPGVADSLDGLRADLAAGRRPVAVRVYRRRLCAADAAALLGDGSYSRWPVIAGVAFAEPVLHPGDVLLTDARLFREVRAKPGGRIDESALLDCLHITTTHGGTP